MSQSPRLSIIINAHLLPNKYLLQSRPGVLVGCPGWVPFQAELRMFTFLTAHRSVQEFGPVCMPRLHATEGVGGEELAAPVGEMPAWATPFPTPVAQQQVLHQALCVGKRTCKHRTKFNQGSRLAFSGSALTLLLRTGRARFVNMRPHFNLLISF